MSNVFGIFIGIIGFLGVIALLVDSISSVWKILSSAQNSRTTTTRA
jgi:hypothetical protein